LYADDLAHRHASEHVNSLAVLAGATGAEAGLLRALDTGGVARTTVYFSHYLFEALARTGRVTILGIRPTAPGLTEMTVTPQLADLTWAEATLPTPLHIRATPTVTLDVPPGVRVSACGRTEPEGAP
jgi:alpha-L-rhamnosidase